MSVQTAPSTYPISSPTARQLGRALFGHVIDCAVVPSLDGGTMPVIILRPASRSLQPQPERPPDVQRAARSARAAFDDGRWRCLRRSNRSPAKVRRTARRNERTSSAWSVDPSRGCHLLRPR